MLGRQYGLGTAFAVSVAMRSEPSVDGGASAALVLLPVVGQVAFHGRVESFEQKIAIPSSARQQFGHVAYPFVEDATKGETHEAVDKKVHARIDRHEEMGKGRANERPQGNAVALFFDAATKPIQSEKFMNVEHETRRVANEKQ